MMNRRKCLMSISVRPCILTRWYRAHILLSLRTSNIPYNLTSLPLKYLSNTFNLVLICLFKATTGYITLTIHEISDLHFMKAPMTELIMCNPWKCMMHLRRNVCKARHLWTTCNSRLHKTLMNQFVSTMYVI